jgi:hypothetical protein
LVGRIHSIFGPSREASLREVTHAKAKQFTISAEDRPGILARVANLLGDADVNIVAMNCATFGVRGAIQILVDHVEKARQALDHQCLPYTEQDVFFLELPNASGCLGEFAGKLAARNINVTCGYATAVTGCEKARVVMQVSDLDAAAQIR